MEQSKKMRILVTNDDGINAPGIKILAEELAKIADVTVVAPDRNRSGASHSLTLSQPIRVTELREHYFIVEGTPTDCVHLALTGLLEHTPDIVVSGINDGSNLGDDVIYSGTVGAAMEGRFLGFPAIAVSLVGDTHYRTAALMVRKLVHYLQSVPLEKTMMLNINVPDIAVDEIEGFEVTRLGSRHGAAPAIKQQDPRGRTIYWIGATGEENDAAMGTDFFAVRHKKVSITPLHIDLTSYTAFDEVSHWIKAFEGK